jgi:hypothetical protein
VSLLFFNAVSYLERVYYKRSAFSLICIKAVSLALLAALAFSTACLEADWYCSERFSALFLASIANSILALASEDT